MDTGNHSQAVRWQIVPWTRGYGLDIGCSAYKPFSHMEGVDIYCPVCQGTRAHELGCWGAWHINQFHIADDLPIYATKSRDFIFSSYTLQYLVDPAKALAEWWRILKPGGFLVLHLPENEPIQDPSQIQDVMELIRAPKHSFSLPDIVRFVRDNCGGYDLRVSERIHEKWDQMGEALRMFLVFEKLTGKEIRTSYTKTPKKPKCIVVRYGAFGDMLMVASTLPQLHRHYHVIVNTTPAGMEVLKNDPNVDEWLLQDTGQVPQIELQGYWRHLEGACEKFVNFSEAVETTFLPVAGQCSFHWPPAARRKILGEINYLEFHALLAGVEYRPQDMQFFPTGPERQWAERQRKAIEGRVAVFVLSGSSAHKTWPYLDYAIRHILENHPDWFVVLMGDGLSQMLEAGWENEDRVICTSGDWHIRESLAFVQTADLVVSPQTGICCAVAFVPNVKQILFLSHSSLQNLSHDWPNTITLEPEDCDCFPCHRLHQEGFKYCNQDDKEGTARCAAAISLEQFIEAFETHAAAIRNPQAA